MSEPVRQVDAKTFQPQLLALTETLVMVLTSRGREYFPDPEYASADIAVNLRYSKTIYRLLSFLNADDRRKSDPDWHVEYGVTAMALIRGMIDCLFNVTLVLENPSDWARCYRKSGIQKALRDLDEDLIKYRGDTKWEDYVRERKKHLETVIRASHFSSTDMATDAKWPTMGKYILQLGPGGTSTDHQKFLKNFTYMRWRQYSALAHGAYEAFIGVMGPVPLGAYFLRDHLSHDKRPVVDESYEFMLSGHIGRAAVVLLSTVTELQIRCRIEDHHINPRIVEVWKALQPMLEAQELYSERYSALMKNAGIEP